jgi:hypothetical protein
MHNTGLCSMSMLLSTMENDVLRYRSVLTYNREVFLLEHGMLVKAFDAIDKNYGGLIEPLRTMRDRSGRSYISLIPFVLLLQRQSRAAFESFAAYQPYHGWLLLRPGIESVLIVGKWVDDPANAKIWENREKDRKSYRNAYTGPNLQSKSLTSSEGIRGVLSKVNDDFVHPNPDYYSRHLKMEQPDEKFMEFRLDYFDDGDVVKAHVLSFLHLLLVMQVALAGLIGGVFESPVVLTALLSTFDKTFGETIRTLASKSMEMAAIFEKLGLIASRP